MCCEPTTFCNRVLYTSLIHGCAAQVTKVVIPPAKPDKPNREFGFIHFAAKETVDKLIADAGQGTKPEMDGKTLEVASRPSCGLQYACRNCLEAP